MGDMADFVNSSYPIEYRPLEDRKVQCEVCGMSGLHWRQHTSGKWWLAGTANAWHTCAKAIRRAR